MRAFLALTPDADAALAIDDWRARHWPVAGRDVPPQNLHLTLCFLGDVDEGRLERLARALDEGVARSRGTDGAERSADPSVPPVASDAPSGLDVELDEPGWRADSGVTWLAPSAPPAALLALGKRMRGVAGRAGIRVDKRLFRPHVTLARRVDHPPPAPLSTPCLRCRFERVELYESIFDPRGVRYRELAAWPT